MRKSDLMPYFGSKKNILSMFTTKQRKERCKKERHIYVDNNAPILLVAHIDTVQTPQLIGMTTGSGFDDRLGVYTAHKLCKEYPELFDLLLTDYEESARSTAQFLDPSHNYNLIIELDREGEDYVDYGLASKELHEALELYSLRLSVGSFTDICFMEHIKCNKINTGLGTYGSHSKISGFDLQEYERQINRLMNFVKDYSGETWPEVTSVEFVERYGAPYFGWDYGESYNISPLDDYKCPRCEDDLVEYADTVGTIIECPTCGYIEIISCVDNQGR